MMADMLDHALSLRARGLLVFPLVERGKKPAVKWGKLTIEGVDEKRIRTWWRKTPDANVGVACGPESNVFVLDVDGDRGAASIVALQRMHGLLPRTWHSLTGKGEHYWFRLPPGRECRNTARRLGEGLDTRGAGGYVVAPGSIHETGREYRWDVDGHPDDVDIADAPDWLVELVDPPKAPRNGTPQSAAPDCGSDRYAQAALERELHAVTSAAEGTRNHTLNKAAFSLAGLVATGALPESATREALLEAATGAGLSHKEAAATIASGFQGGLQHPRAVPERQHKPRRPTGRASAPPDHDPETGEIIEPPDDAARGDESGPGEADDFVPALYSEEALALRYSHAHADEARYVSAWGKWLLWRDGCWREDATMEVWRLARRVTRQASDELQGMQKEGAAKSVASAKTVAAIMNLVKSDHRHAAVTDQWDRDPLALNTPGGMVDLRTGTLGDHERTAYCSKILGATPAESVPGDCLWLRFLFRVCDGDAELVAFLKRALGYSLTGLVKEECFFFVYGLGQNGKSKFMEAVTGAMGTYHETASMDTFVATKYEKHPADLAKLKGARFVAAVETEEGRRWDESKIKSITGGDEISARFMRQDFFTFRPQLKLWVAGNHKPGLRNVDKAMRRRVNLIPFLVTIPEEERDRQLSEKLRAERPVILRWMIDGCVEWQRHGLQAPAAVTEATDSYLGAEDTLSQWMDDCCYVGRQHVDTSAAIWASWQAWCERTGEHAGSQRRLSQTLMDRGYEHIKGRDGRKFKGLAVRREQQTGPGYD